MAVCIVLAVTLAAEPADAQASSREPEPLPATEDTDDFDFRPEWRRFGVWDYVGTAAAIGTYYAVEFTMGPPGRVHWSEPVPILDPPFRSLLRLRTRQARERADRASDVFWYGSIAYPVVDSIVTPIVRGASFDMIWQLGMMNLQAYVLASIVIRVPHKTLGRLRPNDLGCREDPDYDEHCDSPTSRRVSFPGGHYAISMTGAGLSCAHHEHADLYGGGTADTVACASALVAANAVNILRLNTDKHWFSDQLVGGLAGFVIGYGMPTWFYYEPFWRSDAEKAARKRSLRSQRESSNDAPFRFAVFPQLGDGQYGISAFGVF